ncbi:MAG: hypothetical protein ABIQ11_12090 [Saprospiraceae bacterium]
MSPQTLKKSALLTVVLVTLIVAGWELYIRSTGFDIGFDDGGSLFAHHRARVYEPKDQSTVFIGSSRIKFDLDIDTWKSLTGEDAIQLACVGSTPRPVLENLANDPEFKGKLVVDVTEGLFFSMAPRNFIRPNEGINYYDEITPSQRASFVINKPLESSFVFLDKDGFSLNAMLDKLQLKNRPRVFALPIFARDFGRTKFNRQDFLGKVFMADTNQWVHQQNVWGGFSRANRLPPVSGPPLDSIIQVVKSSVDKIRARGGEVIFVRTPSSGPYWAGELKGFPREKYWDRLLKETNCEGIHFTDYPAISTYQCPEFSHLSPDDAIDFTKHFIDILKTDFSWMFTNSTNL